MAWAIITIYISKCAQMNPQQLLKTSKFYSKCKKCEIEKTLGGGYHPLGSPKVKNNNCPRLDPWGTPHLIFNQFSLIYRSKTLSKLYSKSSPRPWDNLRALIGRILCPVYCARLCVGYFKNLKP